MLQVPVEHYDRVKKLLEEKQKSKNKSQASSNEALPDPPKPAEAVL